MLIGEKVVLRYPKLQDAEWLFKEITRPAVKKTLSNPALATLTLKKEIAWVKSLPSKRRKFKSLTWVLLDKKTKQLVGVCGFSTIIPEFKYGEMGFWIAQKYWGEGYATDAAKILLKYGFTKLDFNRVEARCVVNNKGSFRVQKKIGMKQEGLLRQRDVFDGKPRDEYMCAILRSE